MNRSGTANKRPHVRRDINYWRNLKPHINILLGRYLFD
jgi:hypothetical protein